MVNNTNIPGLTRESGELVALKVVVMVGHGISETTDNGLCDVYTRVSTSCRAMGLLGSPLFFGWLDLE